MYNTNIAPRNTISVRNFVNSRIANIASTTAMVIHASNPKPRNSNPSILQNKFYSETARSRFFYQFGNLRLQFLACLFRKR